MNGSLPPISRFIRATRSAHLAAIRLPVSTEPVNATQSTRSSDTIRSPTSPAPASSDTVPAGRWLHARGQHQRGDRRELGGLGHHRVARGKRRGQLPRQQQQRVVPGHDRADHAHRLLHHQRELGGLDRRDHPARRSCGRSPRRSRTPRPSTTPRRRSRSAACRPPASSRGPARRRSRAAAPPPRAAGRRAPRRGSTPTARAASRAAAMAASTCSAEAAPTSATVSSVAGFSTASGDPAPGACSPPISSRVSIAARPYQRCGGR